VLGDAGDVVSGNRHDLDLGRHLSPSQGRISLPSRVIQPVPAPSPSAGNSSGVRPMSRWEIPAYRRDLAFQAGDKREPAAVEAWDVLVDDPRVRPLDPPEPVIVPRVSVGGLHIERGGSVALRSARESSERERGQRTQPLSPQLPQPEESVAPGQKLLALLGRSRSAQAAETGNRRAEEAQAAPACRARPRGPPSPPGPPAAAPSRRQPGQRGRSRLTGRDLLAGASATCPGRPRPWLRSWLAPYHRRCRAGRRRRMVDARRGGAPGCGSKSRRH
jgi:hypothetical protein